jgi:hypothetical protein
MYFQVQEYSGRIRGAFDTNLDLDLEAALIPINFYDLLKPHNQFPRKLISGPATKSILT